MIPPEHLVLDRRSVVWGMAALAAFAGSLPKAGHAATVEPLTLWGIPATPSAVFIRAAQSSLLRSVSPEARFQLWKTTDQMRAGIASGEFKLFATSTYAAANFFNRGAGTRMVNVVTWGLLYVMARDDAVTRIEDLAGRKVLLSNKNEAPDLLFRLVLRWAGLDPDKDVACDYVGSPGEAVPLFLAGRGDVAVLHEPAATVAMLRAKKEGLPMFRALDVTELYGRHTGRGPRIPQVGLAVSAKFIESAPDIVAAAHAACIEAGRWARGQPEEAGAQASPLLGLPAPVIAASLPYVRLDVVSAREAKPDIELYFQNLMELSPAIIAGRLPDADFYWG